MHSADAGGLGEVPPTELAAFEARYRFFLNPIRWTSLGLAVCEAMMVGLPIVALATTEMVTVGENGVSATWTPTSTVSPGACTSCCGTRIWARELGEGARRTALRRFSIDRFAADWDETLREQAGQPTVERTNSSTLAT